MIPEGSWCPPVSGPGKHQRAPGDTCLPGWRAAEGRRRRAEQRFDWQEAARARGLEWDARGTDSSDFDEPQGAHRHH